MRWLSRSTALKASVRSFKVGFSIFDNLVFLHCVSAIDIMPSELWPSYVYAMFSHCFVFIPKLMKNSSNNLIPIWPPNLTRCLSFGSIPNSLVVSPLKVHLYTSSQCHLPAWSTIRLMLKAHIKMENNIWKYRIKG